MPPALLNSHFGCDDTNNALNLAMQLGTKSVPGLVFFATGTLRYFRIKHMARSQVLYTKFFLSKVAICAAMSAISLIYMIVVLSMPASVQMSSWLNQCSNSSYAVLFVIQAAAWGFATFLMLFEYQRLLSEAWYANQLFWVLNLIAVCVTIGVLRKEIVNSVFMLCTATFNFAVNTTLVVLMLKTERRTLYNRRLNIEEEYLMSNMNASIVFDATPRNSQQATLSAKFQEKAITQNKQTFF